MFFNETIYKIIINSFFIIIKADLPYNGQFSFQDPATPSAVGIIELHHTVMFFLVGVVFFVFQILVYELYYFCYLVEGSLSLRYFSQRMGFVACTYLEII